MVTDLTLDRWKALSQEDKDAVDDWLDRVHPVEADVYRITILGNRAAVYYHKRNEEGHLTVVGGDVDRSYKVVDAKGWPL